MSPVTRRQFLATASTTVAGAVLAVPSLRALPLPKPDAWAGRAANAFLPPLGETVDLNALALSAVDAAREAGATYADVRVSERQRFDVSQVYGQDLTPYLSMDVDLTYGVRALFGGVWAFSHGILPTTDAIAAVARNAVATAQGRKSSASGAIGPARSGAVSDALATMLISAPVNTGTWTVPIQIDPFAVPVEDQMALMWACQQAVKRVPGAVMQAGLMHFFNWERETRTFASTEGSRVTQTFHRAWPTLGAAADRGMGFVRSRLDSIAPITGGYEVLQGSDLQEQSKVLAEETVRLARLPRRPMEVGRYPMVCDGPALGSLLGCTLGAALEMDRVLGYEAGAAGTSFLDPEENLGTLISSPALTVVGSRSLPVINAAKWDDDGVETRPFPVITEGRLIDYNTSRQTAPTLAPWYRKQGVPVESRGCAVAPTAQDPVLVRMPHWTVSPGTSAATVDELCRDMRRGIVVLGKSVVSMDQQFVSGNLKSELILEVERGKVVRRVSGSTLQFKTRALWKGLQVLGNASTVRPLVDWTFKGEPWVGTEMSLTAPAGAFDSIDLVSLLS